MTNEKMFTTVCAMIRAYGNRDGSADFAETIINTPHKYAAARGMAIPFYGEAAAVLVDIMESMDKKQTARGQLAAVKKFLSDTDARPIYQKIAVKNGLFCACDGYKMIRLKKDFPSLPHCDAVENENWLDPEKTIAGVRKDENATLTPPSVAELKAFIASHDKHAPFIWADCVCVNPAYLLAAIQALPGATFYKPKNYSSPIYFASNDGDGILLPVRPKAEIVEKLAAAYMTEKQQEEEAQRKENAATLEEMAGELENENRKARAAEIIREYLRDEYSSRTAGRYMRELIEAERDEKARAAYVVETAHKLIEETGDIEESAKPFIIRFIDGDITAEECRQIINSIRAESQERAADTAQDNRQTERPEPVNNDGNANRADSQNADRGPQAIHAEIGPECAGIAAAVILSPLAVSTMAGTIKEPRPDTS